MPNDTHRYRITVTPIENDGLQCNGRCTIEFEHACHDDWMRILENSSASAASAATSAPRWSSAPSC